MKYRLVDLGVGAVIDSESVPPQTMALDLYGVWWELEDLWVSVRDRDHAVAVVAAQLLLPEDIDDNNWSVSYWLEEPSARGLNPLTAGDLEDMPFGTVVVDGSGAVYVKGAEDWSVLRLFGATQEIVWGSATDYGVASGHGLKVVYQP